MMRHLIGMAAILAAVAGCTGERARPQPMAPEDAARLTAQVMEPRGGMAVRAGTQVSVQVQARDLNAGNLAGVGYYARRFGAGFPTVDSAAVRFESRSDTTHTFSFVVPSYPNNTQIDIYGIAFSTAGTALVSLPSYVIVVP